MDGKVILIATLAGVLAIGATKAGHGVVKGFKAIGHAAKKVAVHQK